MENMTKRNYKNYVHNNFVIKIILQNSKLKPYIEK